MLAGSTALAHTKKRGEREMESTRDLGKRSES